jgi:subtilisin family serine protease
MRRILPLFLSFAFLIQLCVASEIDPNLQSIMEAAGRGEHISAIAFLSSQVNVQALDLELKERQASLQERHEAIIRALQEVAGESQPMFLRYLESEKAAGEVKGYSSYWINNSIRIKGTKKALSEIAQRPEVSHLYYDYPITLIAPVEVTEDDLGTDGPEIGLRDIRAPECWQQGWTGEGSIVSNLDTGVGGHHPAVEARWRGNQPGVNWWEAWYDPVTNTEYPDDFNTGWFGVNHGSHTMGTMCGADHASGDTVGVAPDALWIAAGVIDRVSIPRTVADACSAFIWISDPDGDPGTSDDVPDVCSNSWGVTTSHGYPPCDETFWSFIDNAEAAGVVVLFAAGNEGPTANSLRRPADRATTENHQFAVGAVDGKNPPNFPIASFSSRGPSNCTPGGETAIKPEAVAPGVDVRSCRRTSGYRKLSGTSMACPHVAGAVAILRQVAPDATVDEIKDALIQTAVDLGSTGNDNTFGWGLIDVHAAALELQQASPIQITLDPENVNLHPGEVLNYTVEGENLTNQSQTFCYWTFVTLPNGNQRGPVFGPVQVTLGPYQTLSADISHLIPGNAPSGHYYYNAYVGPQPYQTWTSESFDFYVSSEATGDLSSSGSWKGRATGFPNAAGESELLPGDFVLAQNYPNPFNGRTEIVYTLGEPQEVSLEVYNLNGQRVRSLVGGSRKAGEHRVIWDGKSHTGEEVTSGVYFYKLKCGDTVLTKRMNLIR